MVEYQDGSEQTLAANIVSGATIPMACDFFFAQ